MERTDLGGTATAQRVYCFNALLRLQDFGKTLAIRACNRILKSTLASGTAWDRVGRVVEVVAVSLRLQQLLLGLGI